MHEQGPAPEERFARDVGGPTRPVSPEAMRLAVAGGTSKKEEPLSREKYITLEMKVGEVLTDTRGDKYLLRKKLGEGGMGAVFEVEDERTGIIRAIKFMNNRMRGVPAAVERFKREIAVLGQVDENPFILSAVDVTHFEIDGQPVVGFVTDFVDGPTLDQEIGREKWIEPKLLVTLAAQLAFALETLRKKGIVHRDLKPQNIFLEKMPSGEMFVRIGDFGIVGFAFESEQTAPQDDPLLDMRTQNLTEFGHVVGTPAFMSPETVSGDLLDHRSDLYSLGILLYDMAVGEPPFTDKQPHRILQKQVMDIAETFARQGASDIPTWIEDITFKLLAKNPKDRFQTAADVFVALKEGVAEHYPELLKEIPFIWDVKPESYDNASVALAA